MSRDSNFLQAAAALGYSFDGELKIGGNYVPLVQDGSHLYVSGQIPRVGNEMVVTGAEASLALLQRVLTPENQIGRSQKDSKKQEHLTLV